MLRARPNASLCLLASRLYRAGLSLFAIISIRSRGFCNSTHRQTHLPVSHPVPTSSVFWTHPRTSPRSCRDPPRFFKTISTSPSTALAAAYRTPIKPSVSVASDSPKTPRNQHHPAIPGSTPLSDKALDEDDTALGSCFFRTSLPLAARLS